MRRWFRYLAILFLIVFVIGLAGSSYELLRMFRITNQLSSIKTPDPELVPLLVRRLQDYNPFVRAEAAKALTRMGTASQAARPELMRALDDPFTLVRCQSMYALRNIAIVDDALMAKIIAGLDDPESSVRQASIITVRVNPKNAKLTQQAIPKLIELLDDPLVASSAAEALGEIGPAATSAIPKMMTAMAKETDLRRLSYIDAFEKFGAAAKPALPLLQPLTQDPDPRISQAATKAIQAITAATP